MPFYIRKAFSSGPIRLNLSKGGLGFSVGVKGARLGVNSKGQAYVHGGRHGVYYRKNLGGGTKENDRQNTLGRTGSTERIFRDTGVTYPTPERFEATPSHEVQIPGPSKWFLRVALIGLILAMWNWLWFALSLVMISIYGYRYKTYQQKKNLLDRLNEKENNALITEEEIQEAQQIFSPEQWRESIGLLFLKHDLIAHILTAKMSPVVVEKYRNLGLDPQRLQQQCDTVYELSVDAAINDHKVNPDEEALLEQLARDINVSKACVKRNQWLVAYYREIWEEAQKPLEAITITRDLKRGETAYFENDGARLLVERVQDRFQRHGQRYAVIGYEIDMEGIVRVTSRVIEIDDGYIREYYIKHIRDIEFNIESQTVEIQLSNRKSPLIITCPEAMRLGMVLEKVVEMSEK